MSSHEDKYQRRLLNSINQVLPELAKGSENSKLNENDIKQIGILIDHDNHANRDKIKELVKREKAYMPYFNQPLDDQRESAIRRLKAFCEARVISVKDFETNPMNIYMAHETFAFVDGSFATKMTVQFNLFGGTVYRLGSEEHRQYFADKIDSAELVGCFGLSELGYGNNAIEMETEATYDADTDEFIVNSPTVLSQKYWITNGACHAMFCVVFAQLKIKGEQMGVHGFIVPIRDPKTLKVLPGCRVEDMGTKIGLNGIDNAKIFFDNVRVPRSAILSKYAEVGKGGNYTWKQEGKVPSRRDKFIRLADQLLSGRLCISSMMIGASKLMLTMSIRYMATRLGVGALGKSDTPILDYQLIQNQVFPLVARTYACQFLHNFAKREYHKRTMMEMAIKNGEKVDPVVFAASQIESSILCSAIKPMNAWLTDNIVITCRERVGGVGFLESNGFGGYFAHAGITAEGDARVLWAKVTKEIGELVQKGLFTRLNELSTDFKCPEITCPTNVDGMLNLLNGLLKLFGARFMHEQQNLAKLYQQAVMGAPKDQKMRVTLYEATMYKYSNEIQAVAEAYANWEALRSFMQVLNPHGADPMLTYNGPKPEKLSENSMMAMSRLALLFALESLEKSSLTLINQNCMTAGQGLQARAVMSELCKQLRPDILNLCKGFNIPEHLILAPIANDWKLFNKGDNFGEIQDTGRFLTNES